MKFENGELKLTPPEAGYIMDILPFYIEGFRAIRDQIMLAQLDWATSILPSETHDRVHGLSRYGWVVGNAEKQWDPVDGEVVRVSSFDNQHLGTLRDLAKLSLKWNEEKIQQIEKKEPVNIENDECDSYREDSNISREEFQRKMILGQNVIAAIEELET